MAGIRCIKKRGFALKKKQPTLTLHAKGKENIVITDASEIGLCITVRKEQGDVDIEPNAYGKSHLNYNKL